MDLQSNNGSSVVIYAYDPSGPAGWTFVALFGLATVTHLVLMFPYRAAFFIPFVIGGIMEAFGYYGRAWSSHDPNNFGAYVLYYLLVVPAPVMLAATIYMALSRIIQALDAEENAWIRPKWSTAIFILNDVVCFVIQIGGLGMQATTSQSIQKTGKKVVLGGLIFQLFVFGLFVLATIKFHLRNKRDPSAITMRMPSLQWTKHMWAIYVLSVCIVVRNIVRIAEYVQGAHGTIVQTEAILYVFDAALMFVVMAVYAVIHPAQLLRTVRRSGKPDSSDEAGMPMVDRSAHSQQRQKSTG